jgi:hypothetical protein
MNAAEHAVVAAIRRGPEAPEGVCNVTRGHQDAIVAMRGRWTRKIFLSGNYSSQLQRRSLKIIVE